VLRTSKFKMVTFLNGWEGVPGGKTHSIQCLDYEMRKQNA